MIFIFFFISSWTNNKRKDTWCASISAFALKAPARGAGTEHLWGSWWPLRASAQTAGQRSSADRGQRPELCTCNHMTRIHLGKTEKSNRTALAVSHTPAVVHPVAQLQLQSAMRVPAVQDGHHPAQRVQVATQICHCRALIRKLKS